MKKVTGLFLVLITLPMLCNAADVAFTVKGLKHNKGRVYVTLYTDPKTYLDDGAEIKVCENKETLAGDSVRIICSLEAATYAAFAFHDKNDNGEFDTNFLGIPKEGYGFSNDAGGVLSSPGFDEASFVVEEDTRMTIHLK